MQEEEAAAGRAAAAAERVRERNRAKKARRREREAADAAGRTEGGSAAGGVHDPTDAACTARSAGQSARGSDSPVADSEQRGTAEVGELSSGAAVAAAVPSWQGTVPEANAAASGTSPAEAPGLELPGARASGFRCSPAAAGAEPASGAPLVAHPVVILCSSWIDEDLGHPGFVSGA